ERARDDARHGALVERPPHLFMDRLGLARVHVLYHGEELAIEGGAYRLRQEMSPGQPDAGDATRGFHFADHRLAVHGLLEQRDLDLEAVPRGLDGFDFHRPPSPRKAASLHPNITTRSRSG